MRILQISGYSLISILGDWVGPVSPAGELSSTPQAVVTSQPGPLPSSPLLTSPLSLLELHHAVPWHRH